MKSSLFKYLVVLLMSACALTSLISVKRDLYEPDPMVQQFIKGLNELQNNGRLDGEVLIVQGDKVLFHALSNDLAPFDEQQFMIGSVSKQFFAVGLLKALYQNTVAINEEARINSVKQKLHDPLSIYLPVNSPIWSGKMPEWAEQVTLHQLLTHTSGIPNYIRTEEYAEKDVFGKKYFESHHTSAEIIKLIADKKLLFKPGTKFAYSNTGYVIIADIIETLAKKSASEYLQEALFNPLGLSSIGNPVQGGWNELKADNRFSRLVPQWNYKFKGDQKVIFRPQHSEDLSCAQGAGSIISSSKDLLRWNQALHKERIVLPEPLYQSLISVSIYEDEFGIGYGIGIGKSVLGKVLVHTGSIGTYRTLLSYFPDIDLSIIALCHISHASDEIIPELNELSESLKESISDEHERGKEAYRIFHEKYQSTRGFEKIGEFWYQLLQNTRL